MNAGAVIRQKREGKGWTQKELSRLIGVHESTLRMYELELKDAPHDVCNVAAVALEAPEVCFAKCSECPCNWLNVCVLDGDQHPAEEILRALEETQEAIEAVTALAATATGKAPRAIVERACDQMLDLATLVAAAVASWCKAHGLRMDEASCKHQSKLVAKGHVKGEVAA